MSETLETALRVFIFHHDEFIGSEAFLGDDPIRVGRAGNASLRLNAPTVSRDHCTLIQVGDRVFVEDRSSGNGTRVNGQRIGERVEIKPIDAVQVGPFELKVRSLTARPPTEQRSVEAEAVTRIEPLLAREKPVDPTGAHRSSPVRERRSDSASWAEETEEELTPAPPWLPLAVPVGASGSSHPAAGPEADAQLRPLVRAGLAHLRELEGALFREAPDELAPRPLRHLDSAPSAPWDVPGSEVALDALFEAASRASADLQRAEIQDEGRAEPRAAAFRPESTPLVQDRPVTPTARRGPITAGRSTSGSGAARTMDPPSIGPRPCANVEVAARQKGALVGCAILRRPGDQYVLGYPTPQGDVAPAPAHLGLRLLRIGQDGGVDLVFPFDVGGYLVRGATTALLPDLTEGRKYSCLRLEPGDIATVVLGTPAGRISYHIRFVGRCPTPGPESSPGPTGSS